jgi:hypothetical protein
MFFFKLNGRSLIAKPISELVNKSISLGKFPEKLKVAQVVPCYKKSNALDKSNYRPVSILPVISKFFERAINDQLVFFFSKFTLTYLLSVLDMGVKLLF